MRGGSDKDGSSPTAEELIVLLTRIGLTVGDMHSITYGMAVNLLYAHADRLKRDNGIEVADPEKQYRMMKADLPLIEEEYRAGNISEKDYKRYISALTSWEKCE